jgi:ferrous iron transport protein B
MSSPALASAPAPTVPQRLTVALVGNPNTGKTSLFNALSGLRQQVGNYPGVTVEKKLGTAKHGSTSLHLVDLPGTYSLAPRSPDEMVAVDVLLGRQAEVGKPEVILNIVDASNLERNLFLTTQLLELGIPVVVALNMMDVAENQGIRVDVARLSQKLGVPLVPIQANKKRGMEELKAAILQAARGDAPQPGPCYPESFNAEIHALRERLPAKLSQEQNLQSGFLLQRLLLDAGGAAEKLYSDKCGPEWLAHVAAARERLAKAGCPVPQVEARTRYQWLRERVRDVVRKEETARPNWTARLDRVLTHKVGGLLIFLAMMFLVFFSIFFLAKWPMDFLKNGVTTLGEWLSTQMAPGILQSFLVDGVLAGVGGVIVFLPQIMILFGFIAILEDCGYMARAAFLMDKLMARCGLSGKSFVPMLSSFACAVPGVMATRVIEDRRDRLVTILIAPLMSCSARLPVYLLLSYAFFAPYGVWVPVLVIFGMYLLGLIVAPLVALALKRTVLKGETPVFIMEMPPYKWPSPSLVVHRMVERGWAFTKRAGTLILATMIVIWALLYFPVTDAQGQRYDLRAQGLQSKLEAVKADATQKEAVEKELNQLKAEWQQQSYLGRTGKTLEPVFVPLGWDWRIGTAALASFPAREVIVGVMGVLFESGKVESDEDRDKLGKDLSSLTWAADSPHAGKPLFTIPVALSVMVFFALCCQCAATLAVIKRETNSWRWPLFTFTYMTVLAYLGALLTYQIGSLFL